MPKLSNFLTQEIKRHIEHLKHNLSICEAILKGEKITELNPANGSYEPLRVIRDVMSFYWSRNLRIAPRKTRGTTPNEVRGVKKRTTKK